MKKTVFLLLACLLLSFTLVSCGDKKEEKPTATEEQQQEEGKNDMEVSFDDLFGQ